MTNIILNEVGTIKRQLELAIEQEFINTCEDEITLLTTIHDDKDEWLEALSEIEDEQGFFITTEGDSNRLYITVFK